MRGTPSLVLIDGSGLVRKHAFGAVDDLRIGAEIGALIQERRPSARAHFRRLRTRGRPASSQSAQGEADANAGALRRRLRHRA